MPSEDQVNGGENKEKFELDPNIPLGLDLRYF